jgi:hypothetical protein
LLLISILKKVLAAPGDILANDPTVLVRVKVPESIKLMVSVPHMVGGA